MRDNSLARQLIALGHDVTMLPTYLPHFLDEEDASPDDIKEWEILDDLEENIQSGKYRIPAFVKLVFKWDEENLERTITIPIKRIAPSGIEEEPY